MESGSNFSFQFSSSYDSENLHLHTTEASQPQDHGANQVAHVGDKFDHVLGNLNQAFKTQGNGSPSYHGLKGSDRGVGGLTSDALSAPCVNQDVYISEPREGTSETDGQFQRRNRHNYVGVQNILQHDNTSTGNDQSMSQYLGPTSSWMASSGPPYPPSLAGITYDTDKHQPNKFDGVLSWRDNHPLGQNDQWPSDVVPGGIMTGTAQTPRNSISWLKAYPNYSDPVSDGESFVFSPAVSFTLGDPTRALGQHAPFQQAQTPHDAGKSSTGLGIAKHQASSPPADAHPPRRRRRESSSSPNPQPAPYQNEGQGKGYEWACPIAKRFGSSNHCPGSTDISRVKQHLSRKHLVDDSPQHRKGKEKQTMRIMTSDQHQRIKEKMPAREVKSWNDIFQILFPDHPLPITPYVDTSLAPQHGQALRNYFKSNLDAFKNKLLGFVRPEGFEQINKIVLDVFDATLDGVKLSSGHQLENPRPANSSHGQRHARFEQRHQDTDATTSVLGHSTTPNSMDWTFNSGAGQNAHSQSYHITRREMTQLEMPAQQQNNPYSLRDRPIICYSQSASNTLELTHPYSSPRNFPNALDSLGSLQQAEQEGFSRQFTDLNPGQSMTYPPNFDTAPAGFYRNSAQSQQQNNWEQYQYGQQEQDETQQQELQVSPRQRENQIFPCPVTNHRE